MNATLMTSWTRVTYHLVRMIGRTERETALQPVFSSLRQARV